MTEIINRSDAKAKGLKRYFTGQPCSRGHLSERLVSNMTCYQCAFERQQALGPEHRRKVSLLTNYGLTTEAYEEMRAKQGNLCPICLRTLKEIPDVDHCHTTGAVRGLLCHSCNIALGLLGDDPQRLLRAITYVTPAA